MFGATLFGPLASTARIAERLTMGNPRVSGTICDLCGHKRAAGLRLRENIKEGHLHLDLSLCPDCRRGVLDYVRRSAGLYRRQK